MKMDIQMSTNEKAIKILIIGDHETQKNLLEYLFIRDEFPRDYIPTVFDNYLANSIVDGKKIKFQIWNTQGQEEQDNLRTLSYANTTVILLCYLISNKETLRSLIDKWIPEVKSLSQSAQMIIVGVERESIEDAESFDNFVTTSELQKAITEANASAFTTVCYKRVEVKHAFNAALILAVYPPIPIGFEKVINFHNSIKCVAVGSTLFLPVCFYDGAPLCLRDVIVGSKTMVFMEENSPKYKGNCEYIIYAFLSNDPNSMREIISNKERYETLREKNPKAEVVLVKINFKKREDKDEVSEEDIEWAKAQVGAKRVINIDDDISCSRMLKYELVGKRMPSDDNSKIKSYWNFHKRDMLSDPTNKCLLIGDRSSIPECDESDSLIFVQPDWKPQAVESIAVILKEENMEQFNKAKSNFPKAKSIFLIDRDEIDEGKANEMIEKYKPDQCVEIPKGDDAGKMLVHQINHNRSCTIA